MKGAAECNATKVCFPAAMKYCAVVGMALSDDSWIQMCVRERAGIPRI